MIVDNLEKAGLVRRERSATDRRYVQVHLTGEGRKVIKEVFPRHAGSISAELSVLTAFEQEELGRICRKLGLGEARHRSPTVAAEGKLVASESDARGKIS